MATFKEQHRSFQYLALELKNLREHNLRFKEGDPQDGILMFAEAAVVLVAIERFLRMILVEEVNNATIYNLLQMATGTARRLITLPDNDRDDAIRRITEVRNTLMHGNYEQAAEALGCTVNEYFKRYFSSEIEQLFNLLDGMLKQIDPETGRPYPEQ